MRADALYSYASNEPRRAALGNKQIDEASRSLSIAILLLKASMRPRRPTRRPCSGLTRPQAMQPDDAVPHPSSRLGAGKTGAQVVSD